MLQNLGKVNKYSKLLRENEENLAIFTVILMAAFGTKNVDSVMGENYFRKSKILDNFGTLQFFIGFQNSG